MVDVEDNVRVVKMYEPDIEALYETMNTVYHFCMSYDLFNQYKNLSNNVNASPLTKQVAKMRNRLQSYIEELDGAIEENAVS